MITASWISDGRYIIGDREYGYKLCVVDFSYEFAHSLTEHQLQILVNEFKNILVQHLNLENDNDQS